MNNFNVIYKILKYLESTLDTGEVDRRIFNSKTFGVSENRFYALLKMLEAEGYITGLILDGDIHLEAKMDSPKITLKGLEYLEDNSVMKKVAAALKELKSAIPGA